MPAPASTTTSKPAFLRLGMTAGTKATRRSPGKVSRGTPTNMRDPPPPGRSSLPAIRFSLELIDQQAKGEGRKAIVCGLGGIDPHEAASETGEPCILIAA